jgi:hypothetical protein
MGESRQRGTFEERKRLSIKRNKDELVKSVFNRDESEDIIFGLELPLF